MVSLLLPLALHGCSFVEGWFGEPEPPPVVAPAAPAAPEPPLEPVERGWKALGRGDAAAALTEAEAAVAATPADDRAWDLLEIAALRGGQPGAALDRLAADAPVGGRADRHHALRATLALAAGRPADALAAARALASVAPGDAAALAAEALLAGAAPPADADPLWTSLAGVVRDPAAAWDPNVDALNGDRAVLLRARALAARGQGAEASRLLGTLAPTTLPMKLVVATARQVGAADRAAAWTAAAAVAEEARRAGDPVGAALLLDAAAGNALGAWQGDALLAAATEARKAAAEAGHAEAAARFAAVAAQAAVRTGQPAPAVEAASVAAAHAATKARGQWWLAMGHALRGDAAAVDAAATGMDGDHLQAARDVARALRGEGPELPSAGLVGTDAALQLLVSAGWLREPAAAYAAALPHAADAPDLDAWARLVGTRGPLVLPEGAPAGLRAENAARGAAVPDAATVVGASGHPLAPGWAALLAGQEPAADAPLAPLGRARRAIAAGDADAAARELAAVSALVPAWRSGPLAPALALDGPALDDLAADFAAAARLADPAPVAAVRHAWYHQASTDARLWSFGVPALRAARPELVQAVWDASARYRYGCLAWAMGGAPFPADAQAALAAAEKAVELVPRPRPTVAELQELAPNAGIVSFAPAGEGWEALVVTEAGAWVHPVPARAAADLAAYVDGLRRGDGRVAAGDRARGTLVDPLMSHLTGVGEYRLVGPAPLSLAPVEAMPEQADGLRYLSAIRKVTHHPDFESLRLVPEVADAFRITLVGVFAGEGDANEFRRLFPDGRVLVGPEATVAAWKADAGGARYLVFGDLPPSSDGGFVLPSGETLRLGDIGGTPLVARAVVVGGSASPDSLLARAAAFRRAGVSSVLLTDWIGDADAHRLLLSRFLEGAGRRLTPSRALAEARTALQRERPDAGPAVWGGLRLMAER